MLQYGGASYPLRIEGAGVGGVGLSELNASGAVYGLTRLSDFSGPYAEVRTGWALGERGKGRIWLKNPNGVLISLSGARQGMQLALGADALLITLE